MIEFINEIKSFLGSESIIIDTQLKKSYEVDWRNKFVANSVAVILPSLTYEIQQIIELCIKYNVKITPQGGNTSTCGASIPRNDGKNHIIINLSKMNKIIEFDTQNSSITVESGCTLSQVKHYVEYLGLYFPLSIASAGSCQIGGNIATNAGGINVIKYGTMRDLVLGIEAITPDGKIINQLSKLRKNNTNFDLKQLFIGSEGTLGIITKATLKLYPYPVNYCTCILGMKSIEKCISLLTELKNNIIPNAFEIINKTTQDIYNLYFPNNSFPLNADWIVLCEFEIHPNLEIEKLYNILNNLIQQPENIIIATNQTERNNIWNMRENIPIAEKLSGYAIKYDISLPISEVSNFIKTNYNTLKKFNLENSIIIFGHLGDGNLHYNIPLTNRILSELEVDNLNNAVYTDVTNLKGSISAEHGIGQLKTKWFSKFCDKNSHNLGKLIKQLIDPINLFNPGKIFD